MDFTIIGLEIKQFSGFGYKGDFSLQGRAAMITGIVAYRPAFLGTMQSDNGVVNI